MIHELTNLLANNNLPTQEVVSFHYIASSFLLSTFLSRVISPNNAGTLLDPCESVKRESHTLFAPDSNGAPVNESAVIVINPVTDSVCNLQCAAGWYHLVYGNKAPFLCAPKTTDRTSREGLPTYPINCISAFLVSRCCAYM